MSDNTRDQDINPAIGGYDALVVEAGTVNGTQYTDKDAQGTTLKVPLALPLTGSYEKTSIDVRRYFSRQGRRVNPQDKRTTLAVRFRAGVATGALPYFEQFFVGGADSLRGYREDRFWGTRMVAGSVELRNPVSQGLIGVLFADYGGAWGTASKYSIPELPQTIGSTGSGCWHRYEGHRLRSAISDSTMVSAARALERTSVWDRHSRGAGKMPGHGRQYVF